MDFLGDILSKAKSRPIDIKRWLEIVRKHPSLVAPKPKKGINPFTKEPMTLKARKDVASVMIDGKRVGLIHWAVDGTDRIDVFGDTEEVIQVAKAVAEQLGCRFKAYSGE